MAPDGRESSDPLLLAGDSPVVDLAALALLLAPPVVAGEFHPGCPWRGVRRVTPTMPTAEAPCSLPELSRRFDLAVAAAVGDAATVGVKFSGGLDSLAVLLRVIGLAGGRRTVVFSTDLIDDTRRSAASAARRLVRDLGIGCDVVVVDPARHRAHPPWSPIGPRLDAMPAVNAAIADLAAERGVEVLLSGDGADELLAVPRFAAAQIARRSQHAIRACG